MSYTPPPPPHSTSFEPTTAMGTSFMTLQYEQLPKPWRISYRLSSSKPMLTLLVTFMFLSTFILPLTSASTTSALTTSLTERGFPCPAPLVPNVKNLTLPNCNPLCCLPCPAADNFYPAGQILHTYRTLSYFRMISIALNTIVLLSHIFLPTRHHHPGWTVLNFILAQWIWLGLTFFYMGGNERELQCVDEVTPSMWGNNSLCTVQGTLHVLLPLVFSLDHN